VNNRTPESESCKRPGLKVISAWVALLVILFNLSNAGRMGIPSLAGSLDGQAVICSAAGHAAGDQRQGPDQQRHSNDCACCLSMCCSAVALPDADAPLASPTSWTALFFTVVPTAQRCPAASAGGAARAPPVAV
jgi:hypothetical protein